MTPEEFELCRDLMEQDARQAQERERRRYRARAWRVITCLLACFWIAAIAFGVSVWPETPFPASNIKEN